MTTIAQFTALAIVLSPLGFVIHAAIHAPAELLALVAAVIG